MDASTQLSTSVSGDGRLAAFRHGGIFFKRLSRVAISSFFWLVFVKAGLAIGAAMAMAARFVQA